MPPGRRFLFISRHSKVSTTWLGHVKFKVTTPLNKVILIGPWIEQPYRSQDILDRQGGCDSGHSDHINDVDRAEVSCSSVIPKWWNPKSLLGWWRPLDWLPKKWEWVWVTRIGSTDNAEARTHKLAVSAYPGYLTELSSWYESFISSSYSYCGSRSKRNPRLRYSRQHLAENLKWLNHLNSNNIGLASKSLSGPEYL